MRYSTVGTAAALVAGAAAARRAPRGSLRGVSPATRPVKRDSFMTGSQVGVFWGQDNTQALSDVCSSGDYDVVFLSFVDSLNPPSINLSDMTGAASTAQAAKDGWSLADFTVAADGGTSVADQISACQSAGVKVMASFGGTVGAGNTRTTFDDSDDATTAADNLW